MTIRWRLGLLCVQLIVLMGGTALVTGRPYAGEPWFFAGLLAVVINPQLIEPFYPRPVDVVANSILGLFLYLTADRSAANLGWQVLAVVLSLSLLLGLCTSVLGAGRTQGRFLRVARATRLLTQPISARKIYSAIFWLAVIEFRPTSHREFWFLGGTWLVLMVLSIPNWESIWTSSTSAQPVARIEGMIGPSRLLVSAPSLPRPGEALALSSGAASAVGVVIGRVQRGSDTWGQVLIADTDACEALRRVSTVSISPVSDGSSSVLGAVDVGSTETSVRFVTAKPLEVGQVVAVRSSGERPPLLYQLTAAEVRDLSARGDSHLTVRTEGNQLGRFNISTLRLERERWVPEPGAPVLLPDALSDGSLKVPEELLRLGCVVGTDTPVFLDWHAACNGHLVILGMTRMGKTSLTVRLGRRLSQDRKVVVLDQTGEYAGKRGLPRYEKDSDWTVPGLSVLEPRPQDVAPDFAYQFLTKVVESAVSEYQEGEPTKRVIIIDEAHQFVPEPTGLGFNAPGRDSAYKFGITMMQVRKYGVTIVLVSQRTAVVAKSALSQCENVVAFRNVDQTGLDYLEAVGGGGVRRLLPQLRQGEALVFGPAISAEGPVAIAVDHED